MPIPNEMTLADQLDRLESGLVGSSSDLRGALGARLADARRAEPDIQIRFPLDGSLDEALVRAMLARHGLQGYRERGQKRTTLMARMPRRYYEEVFAFAFREARRLFHAQLRLAAEPVLRGILPAGISPCPSCLHPKTETAGHAHGEEVEEDGEEVAVLGRAIASALAEARASAPSSEPARSLPSRAPSAPPVSSATASVSRNASCPCGSGRKFKRCCGRDA